MNWWDLIFACAILAVGSFIIISQTAEMPAPILWLGYGVCALGVACLIAWWVRTTW